MIDATTDATIGATAEVVAERPSRTDPADADEASAGIATTPNPSPGTIARLQATARRASAWGVAARETHQSVDVGFRLADRDKRVAAGVLAGGVAYRLFFWLIALSVLVTGAFGFATGARLARMLETMGVPPLAAEVMIDLARGSQEDRWWVLLVGGWLVLWTGYLGGKALVLVHAAVWGVPPPPPAPPWVVSLVFTAAGLALVAAMSVTAWLHSTSQALAVLAGLLSTVLPGAIWLAVSRLLPHRGVTWRDLAPGALLVAVGIQVFTIFTIWFLAPKLSSATERYGLAGIAATLLFWLYLIGRLVIAGATLNASVHEQRTATAETRARSSR